MYVIGTNEYDFIKVRKKTLISYTETWMEVETVIYDCNLGKSTLFPDYVYACKILKEIRENKNKIRFTNDSIIGEILDEGKEFDVGKLKLYKLVAKECECSDCGTCQHCRLDYKGREE